MWSTSFAGVILPLSRQCTQSGFRSRKDSRCLRQRAPYKAEELFAPPHEVVGCSFGVGVAKRGFSMLSLAIKALAFGGLRCATVKVDHVGEQRLVYLDKAFDCGAETVEASVV